MVDDKLSEDKIPLIVLVGQTASGKTSAAVELALRYNGEVVSADSMQLYKTMSIGTAKPTASEMKGIPHHLIDCLPLEASCSVADYAKMAHTAIFDIVSRGKTPILTGGTGLYIKAVTEDMLFDRDEKRSDEIRNNITRLLDNNGKEALFEKLLVLDPEEALKIDKNNPARLIRALEICELTKGTVTEYKKRNISNNSRYRVLKLGIGFHNREMLYQRINQRVDMMLQDGLLEEAAAILGASTQTAFQAIGYKELVGYFAKVESLESAAAKIKQESRRYAKRQLTWFRRDESINWVYRDNYQECRILEEDVFIKNICDIVDNFYKV